MSIFLKISSNQLLWLEQCKRSSNTCKINHLKLSRRRFDSWHGVEVWAPLILNNRLCLWMRGWNFFLATELVVPLRKIRPDEATGYTRPRMRFLWICGHGISFPKRNGSWRTPRTIVIPLVDPTEGCPSCGITTFNSSPPSSPLKSRTHLLSNEGTRPDGRRSALKSRPFSRKDEASQYLSSWIVSSVEAFEVP